MHNLFKAFCAGSLMTATGAVLAASTADLKVAGTIIPAACTPVFSGGGTVDFGKISAKDLSPTKLTALPRKFFTWTISCSAPTRIALSFKDNRPLLISSFDFNPTNKPLGQNIGIYYLYQERQETLADGVAVDTIASSDSGAVWNKPTSALIHRDANWLFSFANKDTLTPTAFKNLSGKIRLDMEVRKTNDLDITKEIPIDGLATMTVTYL
ncbi:DUF1120 domain-containing protein [Pseudomonas sp. 5P_3.1_Bac2]|uniref:DUF1120 domain-containing protein n=1 Tax=Pseudomonas sp. 5P_3.1_Bac2 TaxID=2971617 RepID=UPI0021C92D1E|nr:DUF1120 domain-containing protein [Pseudomonas sp. 5P_3.1_Bac2]MCU1717133.1 DUF1120 domain-containing protein [Pseudomonas sp. 5P_3.1_Bac2]